MRDIFRADYRAHEALVRGARRRFAVAGIIPVLSIMAVVFWYGYELFWLALYHAMPEQTYSNVYHDFDTLLLPESLLIVLYGFALIWAGLLVGTMLIHRRGFASLMGAPRTIAHQSIRSGRALIVLMLAVWLLPPYSFADPATPGLAPSIWLSLLLPALIGILIQTSAEEVLFRGYLQQHLATLSASPWVWMVLPSAVFGLAHYAPGTYGSNAWYVVIWATLFGLVTADLTARAGTLGPAITLHFLSNASAFLLIAPQGEMSGLALYQYGFATTDEAALRSFLPYDFAMMVLGWLAIRIALRR